MNEDRKTGKIQLVLVILFVMGAFAASKVLESTYEPPSKRKVEERVLSVEVKEVRSAPHRVSFKTTGSVEARSEITVVPQVSGRIMSVQESFSEGSNFIAGEILFQIDHRDFQLDAQKLGAEVARARTALNLEEAESRAALEEWRQLHPKKQAPDLVLRKPQLEEARAALRSAEAQYEKAQLNLERTNFVLPFNGTVLESNISVGQHVSAGQSYGRVFDKESLEIRASLQDQKLKWLLQTKDPLVTIRTTYLGQLRTYQGKLKRSAASLDTSTRFATVRFGFDDSVVDILPGIFVDVEVKGPKLDQVMLLPSAALQTDGVVWVEEKNILKKWMPEIIYIEDDFVAVQGKPTPLNIVVNRINGGFEGMKVRAFSKALAKKGK